MLISTWKMQGICIKYLKSLSNVQKCWCSTKKETTRKMPIELTRETNITTKVELSKLITKKDLEWRTPWHQKEGKYYDVLRTFYSEENNVNIMKWLNMPKNISPSAIMEWWAGRKVEKDIFLQQYIPERNQILGNELAASHFIVHRGGSVKFFAEDRWIKANQYNQYELPKFYESDKILQAIDCSDVNLYYEGLVNFRGLKKLEWFSINGCDEMDDWALDRISNLLSETVLYLDIRNCPKITYRGLGALCKMKNLRILYVDDKTQSYEYEMVCLMLEELYPNLDIRE